jgi:hypothetical protein
MNAHIAGRNVVVTVTGEDSDTVRAAARKVACGEAHTALIGKLLTVKETRDGHAYTWGPVVTRKGAPKVAPTKTRGEVAAEAMVGDDHAWNLAHKIAAAIGVDGGDVAAIAAILHTGDAPKAAAPKAPKAEFAPVKAARERAEAAACKTCRDFGVVRITPRENGDVHYRTPNGATGATAIGRSKPCEARGCKAGKAARKARKAA